MNNRKCLAALDDSATGLFGTPSEARLNSHSCAGLRTPNRGFGERRIRGFCVGLLCFVSGFRRYRFRTLHSVHGGRDLCKLLVFQCLIGSTRDAWCAGTKPAQSATSASAIAESASTAGSAP